MAIVFYNYRNEVFSSESTSPLGAHYFIIVFVILTYLAALFALVSA